MLFVDGVVADFGRGKHVAPAAAYALTDRFCVDIAAADDGKLSLVKDKALCKLFTAQTHAAHCIQTVGQRVDGDILGVEGIGEFFEALNAARKHEHAVAARPPIFYVLNEGGNGI